MRLLREYKLLNIRNCFLVVVRREWQHCTLYEGHCSRTVSGRKSASAPRLTNSSTMMRAASKRHLDLATTNNRSKLSPWLLLACRERAHEHYDHPHEARSAQLHPLPHSEGSTPQRHYTLISSPHHGSNHKSREHRQRMTTAANHRKVVHVVRKTPMCLKNTTSPPLDCTADPRKPSLIPNRTPLANP